MKLLLIFIVHIHSMNNVNAYITGGPLFEKKYTFSHIHILYWGAEGEVGSAHEINSQG